ncbi:MAG TPA: response regulator transcription factor [Jatrophihabitans sp.]|uniref:response regulator transcription factor n=1 Tax=Jatrophihabitans sp. TaxID=1932789 RepID=UPI002DFF3FFF|nr:response regulator transcription factor [Jatrophihabitans sp.]
MSRLLLVEDDDDIGARLQAQFEQHHHTVVWARNGATSILEAADGEFDLILLDLGLPDLHGFDVCRALRSAQPGSVLVILTASMEEVDVIVSLEAGADDYITKPFRTAELLARLRAHLRRRSAAGSVAPRLRVGALDIDGSIRDAHVHGRSLDLPAKEFDILVRLATQPGMTISRATLIADVWGHAFTGTPKNLDVHVSALRRRLAEAADPAQPGPRIVTVRGRGYRLEI